MMAAITADFDVADFVRVVRIYLGDLPDETCDELTDGLAADLVDLLADQGSDALPDPEMYADELRAAAGILPRPAAAETAPKQNAVVRVDAALDAVGHRAWRTLDSRAGRLGASYAIELRPVWWCTRAQVGFWIWQTAVGGQNAVTLTPFGSALDMIVWTLFLAFSIRLGRLTRSAIPPASRLWLLAMNAGALVSLPYFVDRLQSVLHG